MNAIDQYNIIKSWEQSLVPSASLIDGRTEQDRLNFLCDYASLINFYDSNNKLKGNWSPFLIKDPVFLLAHIAKTRFTAFHSRYLNTCATLDRLFQNPDEHPEHYNEDIARAFNLLFGEFTDIFIHIKRWIYFMRMTNDEYDLKTYIIYQTKTNFSQYYWAFSSLQQSLFMSSFIKGIDPVDHHQFYFFDAYEEVIWKENKDSNPYWKVLGLKDHLKGNTSEDIYRALKNAGDKLFAFFHTLVKNADAGFAKLSTQKSRYPDTTLLRAFVHLLKAHEDQLNGIAQKHLQFYYKDILKQEEKAATADSVFLCSALAKPTSTFSLPAGTVFNAGLDAQKKPILFSTTGVVHLNPATITGGYTLSKSARPGVNAPLYLKSIPAPGVIQKDKTGKVQSWETFGGSGAMQKTVIKPGIAFASPLLFLQEGERDISLAITFSNIDPGPMPSVKYFLSTLTGWLEVTHRIKKKESGYVGTGLNAVIALKAIDPPIEAFQKINPDALDSQWPLLKLEFSSFTNLVQPLIVNTLSISVNVVGVKTFQLFNDYGSLSTKTPFPLFGPAPLVNNSFIIGSSEIFSKPLDSLVIELKWDQLPTDFAAYYERYNAYASKNIPPIPPVPTSTPQSIPVQPPPPPPLPPPGCWLWRVIKSWFSKPNVTLLQPMPFNDECFTVNFSLLQDASWEEFLMTRYIENPPGSTVKFIPNPAGSSDPQPAGENVGLFVPFFQFDNASGQWVDRYLTDSSIFGYPPDTSVTNPAKKGDPAIQNSTLKFTDASSSGFMRMTLSGPQLYGFGSGIYANVVSCIALTNAMAIADKPLLCPPAFSPPANLPFVPKLGSFMGYYSASCKYNFPPSSTPQTYPLQCFLYTPFSNYLVYDNSIPAEGSPKPAEYNYIIGGSGTTTVKDGIPLFETFNYDGYLFLEMSDLLPSASFNLYFELARNYKNSSAAGDIGYFYASKKGWKKLPLLSDGTNKFSCSGIITVAIPDDVANDAPFMPGTSYWICIGVPDPAASFSQTVFFQTNGFIAKRNSSISTTITAAPKLAANTISKPQTAIPQILATVQPFPSFGGKAAETYTDMNQRISGRLLTKDRAVSAGDYSMLIKQAFNDIYFAKAIFHPDEITGIYVVKGYAGTTEPNAFLPLVSECQEEKINHYLNNRTSAFSNITVSNFSVQYVKIIAKVTIDPNLEPLDIQQSIDQSLNIFLSPWITSTSQQVIIGQTINGAMVAGLLKNITGVLSVDDVRFQSWRINSANQNKWSVIGNLWGEPTVAPASETALLVSYMNHNIQCKSGNQ
jgi:hypothetical protein